MPIHSQNESVAARPAGTVTVWDTCAVSAAAPVPPNQIQRVPDFGPAVPPPVPQIDALASQLL
jgi:hypothetical protein